MGGQSVISPVGLKWHLAQSVNAKFPLEKREHINLYQLSWASVNLKPFSYMGT